MKPHSAAFDARSSGDMSMTLAASSSYSAKVLAPSRRVGHANRRRVAVVLASTSTKATDASEMTVPERKQRLVQLCAKTDRGKSATPEVAAEIESIVASLESINPTKDPATNKELITGKWSLLYTGASAEDAAKRAELEGAIGSALTEVSGSSGNVAVDTAAGSSDAAASSDGGSSMKPMGRTISTFSGSAVDNKGNFQDIDAFKGEVFNRAELALFGVPLEVKIVASCVPVDPSVTGGQSVRLAIAFRNVNLTLGPLPTLTISLTWINDGKGPEGWLDTTYLDDDLRLGRGDKGSTFVTVRRK